MEHRVLLMDQSAPLDAFTALLVECRAVWRCIGSFGNSLGSICGIWALLEGYKAGSIYTYIYMYIYVCICAHMYVP